MDAAADGAVRVDLNSDLGEVWRGTPMADDDAMFGIVTSANVACGFHAGDAASMRTAVRRAAENGVSLGAHPSYRDEEGFGRRARDVDSDELEADVLEQVLALQAAVTELAQAGGRTAPVAYVKPHGALYNRIAVDAVQAGAVVRAVLEASGRIGRELPILGLAGTVVEERTRAAGLRFVSEAFVDRAYRRDGSLVPRGEPGSVVDDRAQAVERAVRMVTGHQVVAVDGTVLDLAPDSLCVHGDTAGAVQLAGAVRAALIDAGVRLAPPW
ncbi:LamB/YcsF family protein [Plantibacter flavus]|uniref:LamB/YcsF family protein n=1 Tax=Plantibacter flavus TaxID=150123 RepID=UPI003F18559B